MIEHEVLLLEEVSIGNLEPWFLAKVPDLMCAEGDSGNITSPNGFFHGDTNEKPELAFENCVKLGTSPYFKVNNARFSCVRLN